LNYSLHHGYEGDGVNGVEGATVGGSSSVSPSIFAVYKSVSCISSFYVDSFAISPGGSYLQMVLGHEASLESKKEGKGPMRGKQIFPM
jgi:hypothetical protein